MAAPFNLHQLGFPIRVPSLPFTKLPSTQVQCLQFISKPSQPTMLPWQPRVASVLVQCLLSIKQLMVVQVVQVGEDQEDQEVEESHQEEDMLSITCRQDPMLADNLLKCTPINNP